ncbi:MAG TPA: cation-transporting P-type ATPase [Gemmatimonadaceae bacterium]|nr:cation-transporting P-type ATPase [Gemmatimonadaceae bacterium]
MSVPEALARSESSAAGLSVGEARRRLAVHGPNRIRVAPPTSAWAILVAQLRSVVMALLVAATAVAWLTADRADAAAIAVVIVINVAIGFTTELRARRAMEALRGLEVPRATALRDSQPVDVDARDLVPGDVVIVEAGQRVPADARVVEAAELRADEAALTGESVPVDKDVAPTAADAPLPERSSMLYQSSSVVAGAARALVVATGDHTELGRIGALTSAIAEERTPLEKRLDDLGRRLVWLTLAIGGGVVALGVLRGVPFGRALETGLALAVAAVPEGLPAVATIALAVGVARMARRHALVRRLPVVETLGSATVVCSDKTGTLTAGEMTVTRIYVDGATLAVGGTGYEPRGEIAAVDGGAPPPLVLLEQLLRVGVLASRAGLARRDGGWAISGDPTEAALLVVARKGGIDPDEERRSRRERGSVPFSSERGWMAIFHDGRGGAGGLELSLKGGPSRVLERCSRVATADGDHALDDAAREKVLAANRSLAARGLRVLALARGEVRAADESVARGLTFVGLVGMADPPAAGVTETIARLRGAGLRTVMITGDQQLTAEAVARELGVLADGQTTLDGRELAHLDDAALDANVERVAAFSRVSPADKLRIVGALQRRGEVVAMLGDGVNDAAALRKADVGVAMGGRGTDVAKEAAAVVLQDDRFATVAAAVEEGRAIYDNIRKFVFYLFSCNVAEILVIVGAGVAALPQPLAALQLLWLNLVTDTFPALALAVEPPEADVMARPPRDPRAELLSADFLRGVAVYGAAITAVTLAAFVISLGGAHPERAQTMAFMTLALAQALHLGNARSAAPVLAPGAAVGNRWALAAVALVVALQVATVRVPALSVALGVRPLDARDWALAVGLAAAPAVLGQAWKVARGRVGGVGRALTPPRPSPD